MDTKELVNKIAKLKNAIESESDPDVKKAYQKKVDAIEKQIAEAEVKVEKVEAKAAAEEKKDLNEAEVKIQKLKAALASETDPDVKERYQKKIKQLEETLKDVKQEIKEEKKEIAEQKKDIKAATKEVKSAQKEVRKTAIKKVADKVVERKQVVTRKAKRKTKIKSIISDLDALINKNKELKAKYKGKGVDLKRDAGRAAKPFGYRFVGKHDYRVPTEAQVRKGLKRGTIDYEGRPNRSDKYPKAVAKLAKGGQTFNDSETDEFYEDLQVHVQGKGTIYKGKSLKEATKAFDDYYANHPHAEIVMVDEKYGDELKWANVDSDNDEYKKGGTVKKKKVASKSKPKPSKKVGKSVQDKHRFAKPAGWRWKEEALQKRIIERKQLTMSPSKKMRDKYPDYVYYEDRLNKADQKPTRSSADSI